jgi:uncharacterized membrane protein YsdA (DUF1294 family)
MISQAEFAEFFVVYGVLNIVVFCIYAHDKIKAKRNAWRTSEGVLLALALVGPFGAFAAMIIFHHKTRKVRFFLVPVFLCIHLILAGYILLRM